MKKTLFAILLLFSLFYNRNLFAQCADGSCNSYAFLNPGTTAQNIEYDNFVSGFHSSMVREADGGVRVWGQGINSTGGNQLQPQLINATNYPGLTGTILRFTLGTAGSTSGAEQFAVLTTDGLFVWGDQGYLINSNITSSQTFARVSIGTSGVTNANSTGYSKGLPNGVNPTDVKMMFGSYQTLVIVTCDGAAWVLSSNGSKNGDGTSQTSANNQVWHRVKTDASTNLTGVLAVRGTPNALMALTYNGTNYKIYTWGSDTYLSDGPSGSNKTDRTYATEMTMPAGFTGTPKMIGMTQASSSRQSYYLLSSNGTLYSLGDNNERQLGDGTKSERQKWVLAASAAGNIAWISPNEHDNYKIAAINVLTTGGKLWAWGSNEGKMIGGATDGDDYNPMSMPGGLGANDLILAVETGGHTTAVVKKCSGNYGYVGHRINGSMGDGSTSEAFENTFNFSGTPALNICSAVSGGAVLHNVAQADVHIGAPAIQLSYTPAGGTFSIVSGSATVTQTGQLTINSKYPTLIVKYEVQTDCGTSASQITVDVSSLAANYADVQANVLDGTLFINWSTLSEANASHFDIEASLDGTNFTKIGEVLTKAKDGNSSELLNYNFSTTASSAVAVLGFNLLVIGGLGFGLSRRRKLLFGLILLVGMATVYASCSKDDARTQSRNGEMFVRVAQVDKSGNITYSKTVKAVNQ